MAVRIGHDAGLADRLGSAGDRGEGDRAARRHGDLHALQPGDIDGLRAAKGSDFDRIAVALLLGNLHNTMETLRMATAGSAYPKVKSLAETMTATRQGQIQRLLALAAG